MIGLMEGWPFHFDGVLQQRDTAKIIFSLADDFAEFLEEVLQLLLLDGRQVFWYGWLAKRLGGSWWWLRVSDGDLPLRCPHSVPSAGGEALDGDYGSRPIFRSRRRAWGLRKQTLVEHPRGRSRHLQRARGSDSGPIKGFQQRCRWSGAAVHGWWGGGRRILLLSGVEMYSLRIRARGCCGAIGHVDADA